MPKDQEKNTPLNSQDLGAEIEDNCLDCGRDLDNWDNNPFLVRCPKCQQLWQAYGLVSEHLTDINAHTIGQLLDWVFNQTNPEKDEVFYRATLVAQNYLNPPHLNN